MKLLSQLRDWLGWVSTDEDEEKPVDKTAEIKPDNLLWKQYNVYVGLFKFYVDTAWKVTTWFYAITGAILTYYFANANTNPLLIFSLILPFLLSIGLWLIFTHGVNQMKDLNKHLTRIRDALELPGKPHVDVLTLFLRMGSLLFLLVAAGLFAMFVLALLGHI